MKNMKKVIVLLCTLVLLFSLGAGSVFAAAGGDFAGKTYNLRVGTTSVGGVYNLVATGWAQTFQKFLPNVVWDVQVTGGSVGNLQLFENNELDLPMALSVTMVEAMAGGTDSFPDPLAMRSITVINDGFFHIVAANGSGINSIEDLKGKRISTGEPGHSTESVAITLFDVMGWSIDTDISRQRLNLQDSVDALGDGRIDAMFYMGGAPVAGIQEACVTSKTGYMLSVDPKVVEQVTQKYPHIILGSAPAGMFANEVPVTSLITNNFLVCTPDMDEELVYQMTKTLFEHTADWQGSHSSVANLTAERACTGSPVEFHPGAIRYYKEAGVWPEP